LGPVRNHAVAVPLPSKVAPEHGRQKGKPMNRLLVGALAGLTATTAMTFAMARLHRALPAAERYPLPPREITEATIAKTAREPAAQNATLLSSAISVLGWQPARFMARSG
jgi:hypothetical protein